MPRATHLSPSPDCSRLQVSRRSVLRGTGNSDSPRPEINKSLAVPATPWAKTARANPHTVFEDECTILIREPTNNAKLHGFSKRPPLAESADGN